jgi:phage replication-related protein YjqB (UPF0714/DUF867 family)
MGNTQGSFNARFEVELDENHVHREECNANENQLNSIVRYSGEQVRIEFHTENENAILGAIFTVSEPPFLSDVDRVILGNRIKNLDNCKLSGDACKGEVKAQIMLEGLDEHEDQAKDIGELIEKLNHDVQNHKLVVIAPHGGNIEPGTDLEAEYVANHFSCDRVSLWLCKGFSSKTNGQPNEDALERWHITSTKISEKSFPKLNTIIGNNPSFDYSIAFHGWTENSICVGGNPDNPDHELKCDIKAAIKNALKERNSDIEVHLSPCPVGQFNGDNPKNIVNCLGTNAIQIEQCRDARDNFHDDIAQAVVNVIGSRINA